MSALPIAADDAAASIIAIRTSSFLFIIVGMYLDILYDVFCFVRFACFTFYEHIQCIEKMNSTRPRASPVPRLAGLLFSRRGLAFCGIIVAACLHSHSSSASASAKKYRCLL